MNKVEFQNYSFEAATMNDVGHYWGFLASNVFDMVTPAKLNYSDLKNFDEFFVAKFQGKVIASIVLAVKENGPLLHSLFVCPKHRKKGIGRKLVELAIDRFVEENRIPIYVVVQSQGMENLLNSLPKEKLSLFNMRIEHDFFVYNFKESEDC